MSDATLELYTALVDVGIPKEKAEKVAKDFSTRQEAKEMLATKSDLSELKSDLSRTLYTSLIAQAGLIISAITLLLTVLKLG